VAKKLFGTDGIRGVANSDLTPELALKLGQAVVTYLATPPGESLDVSKASPESAVRPRFLIGRDTRRSGEMLEGALAAGITSAGGEALLAGIVPTPTVARLLHDLDCSGGIVISASHNTPEYNGLKVFSGEGFKLPDAVEAQIEAFLQGNTDNPGESLDEVRSLARPIGTAVGTVEVIADAAERYLAHLTDLFEPNSLAGLKIALDCGHGASAYTSPEAFRRLGAEVTALNTDFNGDDINVASGSTHLEPLIECVQSGTFDLGIAHDGDADRMLAVDETGAPIDGDQIMAICAADLLQRGELPGPTVVSTVMANLGFDLALRDLGIKVEKTQVGDRYVLERMRDIGATLGGEQSGHIIFLEHNTTGDGLLSALMLASIVARTKKPASELAQVMTKYPQAMTNVRVAHKDKLAENKTIAAAVAQAEAALNGSGRILVRTSGTEPLVRVMAEAADLDTAEAVVAQLVTIVEAELN
jgi:phosphoglucosamine mutase